MTEPKKVDWAEDKKVTAHRWCSACRYEVEKGRLDGNYDPKTMGGNICYRHGLIVSRIFHDLDLRFLIGVG